VEFGSAARTTCDGTCEAAGWLTPATAARRGSSLGVHPERAVRNARLRTDNLDDAAPITNSLEGTTMISVYYVPDDGDSHDHDQPLAGFRETTVLTLFIPEDVGTYLIIAKVVLGNDDADFQPASAFLTTLDGQTTLDRADVVLGPYATNVQGSQEVSLQATMELPHDGFNNIVDLRCSTFSGDAVLPKLFVVSVDRRAFSPLH
jgi:hypothetical protein